MTKALKIVALITFAGLATGALMKWLDMELAKIVLPMFMFMMAFILMPFFLFWRYDDKQQKKKALQEEGQESEGL